MITNDAQLKRTREALILLESALSSLNKDRGRIHPARFALMAEPILDDVRQLRHLINEYVGVDAAVEATVPLWLRLQGPGIDIANAPSSVITSFIDTLPPVGLQSVVEFLHRGTVGIPTPLIRQACDLRLVTWKSGSVQIGLNLPEYTPELFPDNSISAVVHESLDLFLITASWAGSSDEPAILEEMIPEAERRRVLLSQVSRLIPRPRGGLESVQLTGWRVGPRPVRLTREARERVRAAITRSVQEVTVPEQGTLREIDLDERTFILRNLDDSREIRCQIPDEAIDLLEIAKAGLDHQVRVIGTRKQDPLRRQTLPLQVREIEVLDNVET